MKLNPTQIEALTIVAEMGLQGAVTLSHNSRPAPDGRPGAEACIIDSTAKSLERRGLTYSEERFGPTSPFYPSTQRRHFITAKGVRTLRLLGLWHGYDQDSIR